MPTRGAVFASASEQLTDPEAAWSAGTFGAIAEFTRDTDGGRPSLRASAPTSR